MVNFFRALGQRIRNVWRPVDLDRICATIHHGCMGLPQELVDHIMDMLQDNIPALQACSLTCKAMFASTRHLLHRTLKLGQKNTLHAEFCRISFGDERGLEREYDGLRVHMCAQYSLTPEILLPHLYYSQLLNQVVTLTIEHFYPEDSSTFAHFHRIPTYPFSLLDRPQNRDPQNFALWFPNLKNLFPQWLRLRGRLESSLTDVTTPERTPLLRGCLRLVGHYGISAQPSAALSFCELPEGFNFRSVELQYDNFPGSQAWHELNACARTLEILTITNVHSLDRNELRLTEMTALRQLTLRTTAFSDLDIPLARMLSTIVSPAFYEFVLELGGSSLPERESMIRWGPWRDFDILVEDKFARNRDFRFIIRTGDSSDWEELQRQAKWGCFPQLASRGCIYFEFR